MSTFGHGTFKQELLDSINDLADQHNIRHLDLLSEVLDVVKYFSSDLISDMKDSMRAEVREEVKRELRERLF